MEREVNVSESIFYQLAKQTLNFDHQPPDYKQFLLIKTRQKGEEIQAMILNSSTYSSLMTNKTVIDI